MKSTKFKTKQEKGITLMALIVTIVILLILATVAISSIQNDGIISKAQDVANKFNEAQANEKNMLDEYLSYFESDSGVPDELERYVLGPNKTGRPFSEITYENTMEFKDEASTIPNASTEITIMNMCTIADDTKGLVTMVYKNKIYKLVIDIDTFYTESVELIKGIEEADIASLQYVDYTADGSMYLKGNNKVYKILLGSNSAEIIYEKKGREGQIVEGGTYDGWIILTDRDGLVEIVSPDTVGELTLGSGDTSVTATTDIDGNEEINDDGDKAILSYNNAITRINDYCKEVMNLENVRSVGGTDNTFTPYHSTNYDTLGSAITVDVASPDKQYELDYIKLICFEKLETTEDYWVASRFVFLDGEQLNFIVLRTWNGGLRHQNVWILKQGGVVQGNKPYLGVRPVVINPAGI